MDLVGVVQNLSMELLGASAFQMLQHFESGNQKLRGLHRGLFSDGGPRSRARAERATDFKK